uniref:Uncharacterized protein n=1 Tax=Rangifer tarandus platyrhynchus TaxID=3082113 RepID=A0ACB0E6N7_RANTA|nr:unnamed protein product [Rangifer tarandus platyrhynchus]
MPGARRLPPPGVCSASARRGSSRAARVAPPPPSRPAGAFTGARTSSRRGTRGRDAPSELRLADVEAARLARETGRERRVGSRGCAGLISGERVGWEVWAVREREGGLRPARNFRPQPPWGRGWGRVGTAPGECWPRAAGNDGAPSKVSVVWSSGLLSRHDFGIFPCFLLQECCS